MSVKGGRHGTEVNVLEDVRDTIFETISLLELAFVSGIVSEMNFTILKREYVSLCDTIEVKKVSRESRTDDILGDNFFSVPNPEPLRSDLKNLNQRSDLYSSALVSSPKGHSIRQTTSTMSDRKDPSRSDLKNPSPRSVLGESFSVTRATTDIAKESRRTRILKLIKDNREVTIKDITAHFPDVSEKTIQRELVAMSDSGVLKRMGERRWSRYALA
jgi:DNA-binding transcriptional ArsR family regulator